MGVKKILISFFVVGVSGLWGNTSSLGDEFERAKVDSGVRAHSIVRSVAINSAMVLDMSSLVTVDSGERNSYYVIEEIPKNGSLALVGSRAMGIYITNSRTPAIPPL